MPPVTETTMIWLNAQWQCIFIDNSITSSAETLYRCDQFLPVDEVSEVI